MMELPENLDEMFAGLVQGEEVHVSDSDPAEEAWFKARRGMLTCSKFPLLMQEPRSTSAIFTESCYTYLREVIAERIGSGKESASGPSLRWGHEYEPAAVRAYQERTGKSVNYDSHRFERLTKWVGGSPDALVGDDRVLEIKCPYNPANHVEVLSRFEVPTKYYWQCVGHCYVTRRTHCDFVSFDPRIENRHQLAIIEVRPTEVELAKLSERLGEAITWVKAILHKIESE